MPFKAGIAEDLISTRWFVKRFFEVSGRHVDGVKEISESYDVCASTVFKEFVNNFTDFCNELVKLYQPNVIIVGGNIMNASQLFLADVIQKFEQLPVKVP